MSNFYRRPSIDVSYPVLVHLAKWFQRSRFICEKLTDRYCMPSDDKSSHVAWLVNIFKCFVCDWYWATVMVFNAIFYNISVISWQSVSLVGETGVPGENQWPVASNWQTLLHNVVSNTPRNEHDSNSQLKWC